MWMFSEAVQCGCLVYMFSGAVQCRCLVKVYSVDV